MQFDEQRVQKGGNTRMKVVSNKVFSNKQLDEKKTRSAPFFRAKGMKICLIPTKGERHPCDTRYTCTKADEEIYEDRITTADKTTDYGKTGDMHSIMRKITSASNTNRTMQDNSS